VTSAHPGRVGADNLPVRVGKTEKVARPALGPATLPKAPGTSSSQGSHRLLPLPRRFEPRPVSVAPMIVELPGSAAPILLPIADDRGADAFARYANRLALYGGFKDQRTALKRLEALDLPASTLSSGTGPLIGIVLAEPEQLFSKEDDAITMLIDKVVARGGRPVLIPPRIDLLFPEDKAAQSKGIAALVGSLDGLLGPGGNDVHPFIYHQPNRFAVDTNLARDRAEAALVLAALSSDLYALGICRSHQLWNAISGGSLVQDLQKEGYSSGSQRQLEFGIPLEEPFVRRDKQGRVVFANRVELVSRTQFRRIVGKRSVLTNSSHHQAVKAPGIGFKIAGTVRDPESRVRTIEATEAKNALTVQWHPEALKQRAAGDRLFDTLIHRAEIYRMTKAARSAGRFDVERIVDQMKAHPRYRFMSEDYSWARRTLGGRKAV
jgi:putative glutamine amidotransferase